MIIQNSLGIMIFPVIVFENSGFLGWIILKVYCGEETIHIREKRKNTQNNWEFFKKGSSLGAQ